MKIIDDIVKKIEAGAHHFVQGMKEEAKETKEASAIVGKYIKEGKISKEDEEVLKKQMWDTLKILGIMVPFVLIPGASVLMPIIIKVAKKNKIDLLPSSFSKEINPNNAVQTNSEILTQCEMQGREEKESDPLLPQQQVDSKA